MAEVIRATPSGLRQADYSVDVVRATPGGLEQVVGAGSPPTFNPAWARNSNTIIVAETGADQK